MKSEIVDIDMHIRDTRVLTWVQEITDLEGEPLQIPADRVAEKFICHPNTARAILRRLVSAGHLLIEQKAFRGGRFYKIGKNENSRNRA